MVVASHRGKRRPPCVEQEVARRRFEEHRHIAEAVAKKAKGSLPPWVDLDDLRQVALLALWNCSLRWTPGKASFEWYAYGTISLQVKNLRWREAQRGAVVRLLGDSEEPSARRDCLTSAECGRLHDAMTVLTPCQLDNIEAIYWRGKTLGEYARDRGVKKATIHQTHRRALTRLRRSLEVYNRQKWVANGEDRPTPKLS